MSDTSTTRDAAREELAGGMVVKPNLQRMSGHIMSAGSALSHAHAELDEIQLRRGHWTADERAVRAAMVEASRAIRALRLLTEETGGAFNARMLELARELGMETT